MDLLDGNFNLKEIQQLVGHTYRVWSFAWDPVTEAGGVLAMLASCCGDETERILEHRPSDSWVCRVVVGSFLPTYQIEQKTKKPRYESTSISMPASAIPISSNDVNEIYGTSGHGQHSSTPIPNLAPSASFRGDNWSAPLHSAPEPRNSNTDINISFPGQ